jgi:hypothetical protein
MLVYFMYMKKISQYLLAPSLLRLVTCLSVQHQTYFRTYISASHSVAVAGELYCVCELCSSCSCVLLVQAVNDMEVSINCCMSMYIQTWIHHKSTKGKTSRTICTGSSWSWNPGSFAWKDFSIYSQVRNKTLNTVQNFTTLMMEAGSTSEMSVNFCQTAWWNNPEDSHLHIQNKFTHVQV